LGLSPKVRLELSDCVHAIRASGIPIILVEQDVEFLRDLVGTLNVFDHGSISRRLPQSEIPDHETLMAEMFGGAVANRVEIGLRVFGRHDAIRSSGEVNGLIGWAFQEGLPSIDLAHSDLP